MSLHQGSLFSHMANLKVGGHVVICFANKYVATIAMRKVTLTSRYPTELKGCKFASRLVTVVTDIGEASAGLRVERLS